MLRTFDSTSALLYIAYVKDSLHDGNGGDVGSMSYEERGTWIYLLACAAAYAVYLAIIITRLSTTPAAQVSYVAVLLWTTGASIIASILGRTFFGTGTGTGTGAAGGGSRRDARDREIYRFGEYTSRWFIVACAGAALLMAMAKWDYFWIANVIYLGFVLWAVVGSGVKLAAYRRGLRVPG
jgi:hypothetical protein